MGRRSLKQISRVSKVILRSQKNGKISKHHQGFQQMLKRVTISFTVNFLQARRNNKFSFQLTLTKRKKISGWLDLKLGQDPSKPCSKNTQLWLGAVLKGGRRLRCWNSCNKDTFIIYIWKLIEKKHLKYFWNVFENNL